MTNRRMFYALHKLLESVGVAVDRTPGIPMPKKLSDALYHGCDSNLKVSKATLKTNKQFRTFIRLSEKLPEALSPLLPSRPIIVPL